MADQQQGAPGSTALLIIDMINDLDFETADKLLARMRDVVEPIEALRAAANRLGVPVIYVNDNYDEWRSGADAIVEHCLTKAGAGRDLIERLRPAGDDLFVVKPRFSGFYATNLPVLLPRLGVSRLVLTGVAADICVLFTAADAHMREYDLWVPSDAVASSNPDHCGWALGIMAKAMHADTRPTAEATLEGWVGKG